MSSREIENVNARQYFCRTPCKSWKLSKAIQLYIDQISLPLKSIFELIEQDLIALKAPRKSILNQINDLLEELKVIYKYIIRHLFIDF